ncbi:MAG: KUP/HAK/KT family potassium transporter [Sphingobacteriales bacterium]
MKELDIKKITFGGILIALGIVFGDLGTSPLYTYTAIIGKGAITEVLVLGSVSAIFWTLTFQTTLKYVLITMRADNNGEGGIFSLYALIRRHAKWLIWPAIIGASFMIADSLITPPISVTSAIEGLKGIAPNVPILPIALCILVLLFLFQRTGTGLIGKFFGPAMVIWFGMIAVLGFNFLIKDLSVLKAINPVYAYRLIVEYPGGFWVLGGVFLCTTGAEALYADMGHVGRKNIQMAWILIKISLLFCYFGEAALLKQHIGQTLKAIEPFYGLVPQWFLIPAILISTLATIIASQALISGTYTLFNEAIRLNVWPRLRTAFPSDLRGQVYIPAINWMMMAGCIGMVLYFRESTNMEAAFGLSVTLTMLMTTVLLSFYLRTKRYPKLLTYTILAVYLCIELTFLVANMRKFMHGGWLTLLVGLLLITTMYIWQAGRKLKEKYKKYLPLDDYIPDIIKLSNDTAIPKFATHVVYLTFTKSPAFIERRIIESIFCQQPKRAELYWLLHVDVDDAPYTMSYSVEILAPQDLIYLRFKLGFRVVPRINLYFRKIAAEMIANNEVVYKNNYCVIDERDACGDYRFVVMKSFLSFDNQLPFWTNLMMRTYFILDKISLPDPEAFGLDYNNVVVESVPLIVQKIDNIQLKREI